jgi:hypothetical protein
MGVNGMKFHKKPYHFLLFLLITCWGVSLMSMPGTADVNIWKWIVQNVEEHGFAEGYVQGRVNNPPLGVLLMKGSFNLAGPLQCSETMALKCALLSALLISTGLCFFLTRNALLALLLQLSLTINSVALGYLDIFACPTLLLTLWALRHKKLFVAALLMSTTCLIRWQFLLLAPFMMLHVLEIQGFKDLRTLDYKRYAVGGLLPVALMLLVGWGVAGTGFPYSFKLVLRHSMLSGNALNFNWIYTWALHVWNPEQYGALNDGLITVIKSRDPSLIRLPKFLFYGFYCVALYGFLRQEKTFKNFLIYAIAGYTTYFIFNTGVHENHLVPVCILAIVLCAESINRLPAALALSLALNINMTLFYGISGQDSPFTRVVGGVDISLLLALVFLALWGMLYWPVLRRFQQPVSTALSKTPSTIK